MAGEYYVGVVKNKLPPGPEDENDPDYEKYDTGVENEPKITYIVPKKYNDPRKSGLKVTIEDGKNDIPIKLVSR